VEQFRAGAQDDNGRPALTFKEQKGLEKLAALELREIKSLKSELRREE
jgi:hypothetical protein